MFDYKRFRTSTSIPKDCNLNIDGHFITSITGALLFERINPKIQSTVLIMIVMVLVNSIDFDHLLYDTVYPNRPNVGLNMSNRWHVLHVGSPIIQLAAFYLAAFYRKKHPNVSSVFSGIFLGLLIHMTMDIIAYVIFKENPYSMSVFTLLIYLASYRLFVQSVIQRDKKWTLRKKRLLWFIIGLILMLNFLYMAIFALKLFPVIKGVYSTNRFYLYFLMPAIYPINALLIWGSVNFINKTDPL